MTPFAKCLREELRSVPYHKGKLLIHKCVWNVKGRRAFVCGHWCACKHVCECPCVHAQ